MSYLITDWKWVECFGYLRKGGKLELFFLQENKEV